MVDPAASPRFCPSQHAHASGSLDSALARSTFHDSSAPPVLLSQPEMTRALQRAASRTLQSTLLQTPGHADRAVGGEGQQAADLQRAMREVLDAPNAVAAEEGGSPSQTMRRVSLSAEDGPGDAAVPEMSPQGQALLDAMYEALHGVEGGYVATHGAEAGGERAAPEA